MPHLSLVLTGLLLRVFGRVRDDRQRGDVPGWVLITIMTAGLVTAIWAVAGPKLTDLLDTAISSVTGPKTP